MTTPGGTEPVAVRSAGAAEPPHRPGGEPPGGASPAGAQPAPGGAGAAAVRVVLADDQPLVRAALQMVITDAPGIEVAGEAGNGAEAVALAESLRPDVVVMDIRMPVLDGIEATRRITGLPGGPHVIVLTTFDDDEVVYGALRAGAAGFLVKDMALDDILAAVRLVAAGEGLIAPGVTRRLIREFARRPGPAPGPGRELSVITDREREVLTLVGSGLSNTEIAERLVISVATAKTYVTRLLSKLGARDRVQLVIIAYETGLVSATG
ncbi:response regulator transcription factor [Streptomyces zhihengii]|uniref:response regulator transcription factor n=1 Tax=Streptomyces zhihengii TaxID=1818004 RepID=UPI0033A48DB6